MNTFERYAQAVNFLEGMDNLPLQGDYMIDHQNPEVYLKRMRYFLQLIGNPDSGFKFIHITGTSGKGSVTNTVHEILHEAGKKVGSFTSPYVTTSIEKIKVGGLYISPDEFAGIVDYLKPFIDKAYMAGPYGRPSYFEIFLAIAFIYFQKRGCEWVVLEVGLGGRYDATNIIKKPVVTAITSIDYDHTKLLGKTLGKIAYDKAGIIKKGSMVFTAEQRPELVKLFKKICSEKGASLEQISEQLTHLEYNKELSASIARYVGIKDAYIVKGIEKSKLACRFEIMQKVPMVVLDGAHNRAKMKATTDNLSKLTFRKLHLIVGIADDKDHLPILKQIIPLADRIYFTRFQNKNRKCAHPKILLAKSRRYFKKSAQAKIYLDSLGAFDSALKSVGKGDLILVTGSFFLAGELRKRWYPEKRVLQNRDAFK